MRKAQELSICAFYAALEMNCEDLSRMTNLLCKVLALCAKIDSLDFLERKHALLWEDEMQLKVARCVIG